MRGENRVLMRDLSTAMPSRRMGIGATINMPCARPQVRRTSVLFSSRCVNAFNDRRNWQPARVFNCDRSDRWKVQTIAFPD